MLLLASCAAPGPLPPDAESPGAVVEQRALITGPRAPTLRAAGHDPGWYLVLVPGGQLDFVPADGSRALRAESPPPQVLVPSGFRVYATEIDGRPWSAEWRPYRCVDPLSGTEFPNVVEVRWDGQRYRGCGGPIRRHPTS